MRGSPVISVLMPVYNARKYVGEAIESILNQTFADFEFLILDDGSTDGSLDVLRDYEKRDDRITVTTRPNKGIVATLNELFEQSTGEFLARMDNDDVALPDRFRLQVEAMRADPSLVCVGGAFEVMDQESRFLTFLAVPVSDEDIQRDALAGHGSICHPSAMIRRNAMEQVGGYCADMKGAEDLDLWLRLGEIGKLGNVAEPVLRYRLVQTSVSETAGAEQRQYARMACERAWQRRGIQGQFEASELWRPGKDRASRAKFAMQYGWWAFLSGNRGTALIYGTRAVKAAPLNLDAWRLLVCAAIKPMKSPA